MGTALWAYLCRLVQQWCFSRAGPVRQNAAVYGHGTTPHSCLAVLLLANSMMHYLALDALLIDLPVIGYFPGDGQRSMSQFVVTMSRVLKTFWQSRTQIKKQKRCLSTAQFRPRLQSNDPVRLVSPRRIPMIGRVQYGIVNPLKTRLQQRTSRSGAAEYDHAAGGRAYCTIGHRQLGYLFSTCPGFAELCCDTWSQCPPFPPARSPPGAHPLAHTQLVRRG
jgi:hypothetical protein